MLFKSIVLILCTLLGGLLYRMGGAAKTGKWYDFLINTKARDFGIPTVSLILFIIWCYPNFDKTFWSLILTWGAIFGVQTTYWKKKGTDTKWYNWLFTGLGYSLCWLPTVLVQIFWPSAFLHTHFVGFALRTVCVTGLTILVTSLIKNDVLSENARGWEEIITVPLLFIG